jgi:hypothetical protein
MTDFQKLDPDVRCCVLVALFLQGWAAMELALRDAIGAALKIEEIQLKILCANIRFRDKTDILRTLVDVASSFSAEEKKDAKSKLRKLSRHAMWRNMIAHDPFLADSAGDGVVFGTIKAKGAYDASHTRWSIHRFEGEDRALHAYTDWLDCLAARFKAAPLTRQNYADALRPYLDDVGWQGDMSMPMRRTTPLALRNSLSRPDPIHPDSGQATPEKDSQIPDKPPQE